MRNIKFKCKFCGKEFISKKADKSRIPKYCSKKCYSLSLAKFKKCLNCKKEFYNYQNKYFCSMECAGQHKKEKSLSDKHRKQLSIVKKGKKIPWLYTPEIINKIRLSLIGKINLLNRDDKHPFWKGENASYAAKHNWVRRRLGRPKKCEICGTTENRMYHWANLTGEYRNLNDYIRVCCPCHSKLDGITHQ